MTVEASSLVVVSYAAISFCCRDADFIFYWQPNFRHKTCKLTSLNARTFPKTVVPETLLPFKTGTKGRVKCSDFRVNRNDKVSFHLLRREEYERVCTLNAVRNWSRMAKKTSIRPKLKNDASELISRYISGLTDWRGQTMAQIRKCFHDADPGIVEEWKWMGSPVWSHHGLISVANAHKNKVKLTFSQGAHLPDHHKLFNAGLEGNKWRAIDIYETDRVDEAALKELIRSAVAFNLGGSKKR